MNFPLPPVTLGPVSWPPDYTKVTAWRKIALGQMRADPSSIQGVLKYYEDKPWEFINHWVDTYDPRNATAETPITLPLIMFHKQEELVRMLYELVKTQESGLIDKSRDMGATWICCAFSVWMWLFIPGASIGWGSRKQELVDRLGDPDSIFEKIRQLIRHLPPEFLPLGFSYDKHMAFERIVNPENNATITGEVGDNIGRGGRKSIYFKDESAHYEHAELIEAALSENTRVQIDISTVNGIGTVYDRRREAAIEWAPGKVIPPAYTRMLVMDWSDHPAKTQTWYDQREAKFKREGLVHVFRQEIDRNPAASLVGIIVPFEWVNAAIDAHLKIPEFNNSGQFMGALDVADEGGDLNALSIRKGVILQQATDWSGDEESVGGSTRKTIGICQELGVKRVQYDCIGIGVGVKSEAVRLSKEKKLPHNFEFIPWDAGQDVLHPEQRVVPGDKQSPLNKDYYKNLKAQGWWSLRRRFEKTYQMITEPYIYQYPHDELISLPSTLPNLSKIKRELSQPTITYDTVFRILVDKKPDGAKSPNLGDSIMMNYFPLAGKMIVSDEALEVGRQRLLARGMTAKPHVTTSPRSQLDQFS